MKISSLFLSVVTAFILLLGNKAFAAADIYFVHNDHLGTPQVLTNQEQNVVWQGDYKPFGEVDISIANVELDARFPGQYQDSEAGVYYNYYRDYDPSIGRYIESDPIGLAGGLNTYAYVSGNPIMYIDPFGLMEIFNRDGVSFHAYPKGDGKNESARHGPHGEYHFHVNGDKNKVVDAYTLKPENPDALTRKEKKVLENLSENEKRYLKQACREVFHNNSSALPRLKMRHLSILGGIFGPLMSNSYEETCNIDVTNSTGVCP